MARKRAGGPGETGRKYSRAAPAVRRRGPAAIDREAASERRYADFGAFATMCDNAHMDATIRNLDPRAYRAIKAQASLEGRTIGEVVNEAIRAYVSWPGRRAKSGSLGLLNPEEFPPGNERLSEEIDAIVYGTETGR